MKRKTTKVMLSVLLLASSIFTVGMAIEHYNINTLKEMNLTLSVDSESMEFVNEPLIQNGVTYVPLREFAEYLCIDVAWNEETRNIKVDTYHKNVPNSMGETEISAEQGVVPDEATAIAIGKAILENAMGRSVEYTDGDREFYLTATYYKKDNAWRVSQHGLYQGKVRYGTNFYRPYIVINKSTGEVTSIDLYPQAELLTPLGQREDGSFIIPTEEEDKGTVLLP